MSVSKEEFFRIKSLLLADKINAPRKLETAIRSDIMLVLKSYMDVVNENVDIQVDVDGSGYRLSITARCNRLKF